MLFTIYPDHHVRCDRRVHYARCVSSSHGLRGLPVPRPVAFALALEPPPHVSPHWDAYSCCTTQLSNAKLTAQECTASTTQHRASESALALRPYLTRRVLSLRTLLLCICSGIRCTLTATIRPLLGRARRGATRVWAAALLDGRRIRSRGAAAVSIAGVGRWGTIVTTGLLWRW